MRLIAFVTEPELCNASSFTSANPQALMQIFHLFGAQGERLHGPPPVRMGITQPRPRPRVQGIEQHLLGRVMAP